MLADANGNVSVDFSFSSGNLLTASKLRVCLVKCEQHVK